MALLGYNDLKQFALPSGWDATELSKYALVDGVSYEEMVNNIAVALEVANNEMINDPIFGGMIFLTTELGLEYRASGGNSAAERSEYTRPDPARGTTSGHMLPLKSVDRGMGWTFDYLRKARAAQLEADVADGIENIKLKFQKRALHRFFSNAYNTIATSGKDAPFVDGTTSDINYTPPEYGQAFANSHTHFDRKADDGTGRAAALNAGINHLREHGIFGPYDAVIPETDISAFAAVTGFVKPDRGMQLTTVDTTARAANLTDERYIGLFEGQSGLVRLWASPLVPTDYLGLYRSFGANNMRNPLAVRYAPDFGPGAILLRGEAHRQYPLENATIIHEYGVGVNKGRLNGYACYFAGAGDYTAPSIDS